MFNYFKMFLLPLQSLLFVLPNNNIRIQATYTFHKWWLLFLQAKALTCTAVENKLPCIIWHSHIRNHFFYHLVDGSLEKRSTKHVLGDCQRLFKQKNKSMKNWWDNNESTCVCNDIMIHTKPWNSEFFSLILSDMTMKLWNLGYSSGIIINIQASHRVLKSKKVWTQMWHAFMDYVG